MMRGASAWVRRWLNPQASTGAQAWNTGTPADSRPTWRACLLSQAGAATSPAPTTSRPGFASSLPVCIAGS